MNLQSLINYITMVAAVATVGAVQLLKSPLVPVKFQNHPVPTAIVVSAISTYFALASQHFTFALTNWTEMLGTFATVLLVASLTYTHVVANWTQAKSLEAPKTV